MYMLSVWQSYKLWEIWIIKKTQINFDKDSFFLPIILKSELDQIFDETFH